MTRTTNDRADRIRSARSWRSQTVEDRWDVYRYALSIGWAAAFIWYTPSALLPVLTPATTWIPMCVVIAGSIAAIIGRVRNEHLRVELWGALAVVAGFGFYLLLNVILIVFVSPERIAQTLLVALAMSSAVERLRVLGPKMVEALRVNR